MDEDGTLVPLDDLHHAAQRSVLRKSKPPEVSKTPGGMLCAWRVGHALILSGFRAQFQGQGPFNKDF